MDEAKVLAHQIAGCSDATGQPSNADVRIEAVKKSASELDESSKGDLAETKIVGSRRSVDGQARGELRQPVVGVGGR